MAACPGANANYSSRLPLASTWHRTALRVSSWKSGSTGRLPLICSTLRFDGTFNFCRVMYRSDPIRRRRMEHGLSAGGRQSLRLPVGAHEDSGEPRSGGGSEAPGCSADRRRIGLVLSVVASIGGLAAVGLLLVRLPADYFCDHSPRDFWVHRHPFIRRTGLVLKNLLGAGLVGSGVLLSLPGVPGPGILTILIGLMLLDFPGKRDLERWLIGRPRVARSVNRLRRRYGKSPLECPDSTQAQVR